MVRTHVKKLANPRRVKRNAKSKKRRMSPKQIRIFGTARQKAALKVANRRKRMNGSRRKVTTRRRNESISQGYYDKQGRFRPIRHADDYDPEAVGERSQYARKKKKSRNPALIVTLGAVNPRRSKPTMKVRRRRAKATNKRRRYTTNPRRVVRRRRRATPVANRRRRRNPAAPKVIVRYRNKKQNSHRRHHHTKRNPSLFGASITSKQGLMIVGGALTGVVVSKFAPTLLPSSMTGALGSSSFGPTVLTGAAALAASWVAGKWDKGFGDAVLLGGLVQTVSVALNAFLPAVYSQLGIGLGELVPGQFAVPQNPVRAGIAPPAPPVQVSGGQARVTMNGLARAYGNAF